MATAPMRERVRRLVPEPASRSQAALAVAATAGLVVFMVVHNTGRPEAIRWTPPAATTTSGSQPVAVSPAGLGALARSIGQPIFWVGPRPGVTYELTRTAGAGVAIRYLPAGVRVGDERRALTFRTYPLKDALAATQAIGDEPGAVSHRLAGGGYAAYRPARPTNVYVAYPDLDYQLEVFSPSPADARRAVTSPALRPVPPRP